MTNEKLNKQLEDMLKLMEDVRWEAIPTLSELHKDDVPSSSTQPYQVAISNITGCLFSIERAVKDIKEIYKNAK